MKEIDWSKAPEGATQYDCGSNWPWEKVLGNELYYYSDSDKWYLISGYAANDLGDRRDVIKRPTHSAWNGERLPPVGALCEAAIPHTSGPDNARSMIWIEGSVIAYYEIGGKTYAWFAEGADGFYPPNVLEFRPIRTPEQIAADEREAAVQVIADIISPGDCVGSLDVERAYRVYDAGYRKP
jgi:hypothetical protein